MCHRDHVSNNSKDYWFIFIIYLLAFHSAGVKAVSEPPSLPPPQWNWCYGQANVEKSTISENVKLTCATCIELSIHFNELCSFVFFGSVAKVFPKTKYLYWKKKRLHWTGASSTNKMECARKSTPTIFVRSGTFFFLYRTQVGKCLYTRASNANK